MYELKKKSIKPFIIFLSNHSNFKQLRLKRLQFLIFLFQAIYFPYFFFPLLSNQSFFFRISHVNLKTHKMINTQIRTCRLESLIAINTIGSANQE